MIAEMAVVTGISGRYAAALFELADEQGLLDRVSRDLGQLGEMMEESTDLLRFVNNPVVDRSDQLNTMMFLMEKVGMDGLSRKFVGLVAANRRLFALPGMIKDFHTLHAQSRGEVTAEVISAEALSDHQFGELKENLTAVMSGEVVLDTRVDEGLLGGLVVKVASQMIDSSLKTKLQKLRFAMKGIG